MVITLSMSLLSIPNLGFEHEDKSSVLRPRYRLRVVEVPSPVLVRVLRPGTKEHTNRGVEPRISNFSLNRENRGPCDFDTHRYPRRKEKVWFESRCVRKQHLSSPSPALLAFTEPRGYCGLEMTQRLPPPLPPGLLRINFYALLRTLEESPDPQGHQFSAIVQVRKLCTFGVQSALFGKYW